ncbi:uncharacterized protein N7483_001214 [Penicillium malachiteum]|uniref:uncharacterized protein n=1 Tax=Penicillium malachiteum TaxID=1324776 RepID=UPI0025489CD9|nr:uncharacterized protein N7483_001214 [Penicillium malachiteum]KAJ5736089.1 hypothetical protein N7483_001214 [Penicillium malachiteum]
MASNCQSQDSLDTLPDTSTEDIIVLKKRKVCLNHEIEHAWNAWRPSGQFDSVDWSKATEIENFAIQQAVTEGQIISRGSYSAKALLESINTQKQAQKIYCDRVSHLGEKQPARTLKAVFIRLFTTSRMGININWTGAGKRKRAEQSNWRAELIKAYNAKHPIEDQLWCPVAHIYESKDIVIAAHLFVCMHGQGTMDAIFGKGGDIFEPWNPRMASWSARNLNGILMRESWLLSLILEMAQRVQDQNPGLEVGSVGSSSWGPFKSPFQGPTQQTSGIQVQIPPTGPIPDPTSAFPTSSKRPQILPQMQGFQG